VIYLPNMLLVEKALQSVTSKSGNASGTKISARSVTDKHLALEMAVAALNENFGRVYRNELGVALRPLPTAGYTPSPTTLNARVRELRKKIEREIADLYLLLIQQYGAEGGSPHGKLHGRHSFEVAVDTGLVDKDLQIRPYHSHKHWLKTYEKMLTSLKPGGVYELIVHLGYDDPELKAITNGHPHWGARWRQSDLEVVRSAEFQKFLRQEGFILVTWKDVARALADTAQPPGRS